MINEKTTKLFSCFYKKSSANAKWNARQWCMFEGPLRTNLSYRSSNWYWVRCIYIR